MICLILWPVLGARLAAADGAFPGVAYAPPAELAGQYGAYRPLLRFNDGRPVKTAADWQERRQEILSYWHEVMGPWPAPIAKPTFEYLESKPRENFIQHRVRVEIAPGQFSDGYLLVPKGRGPFPAILVPYYEPETSVGLSDQKERDFGLQLTRRGCVTLSIGSPGGDAWKPRVAGAAESQPLSLLAYIASNCHTALAQLKDVDASKIGIVGHSYGGKWAMFAACLYEKFACGVWSDPGIVFDESRPNVNYWEPWYLGKDANPIRDRGVPSPERPRTGAYKELVATGHDLHELLALMAPRPFLVSGGAEDPPSRWLALNRVVEVYDLLGVNRQVAMTTRKDHAPNPESNGQVYAFFTRHFPLRKTDE